MFKLFSVQVQQPCQLEMENQLLTEESHYEKILIIACADIFKLDREKEVSNLDEAKNANCAYTHPKVDILSDKIELDPVM